MPYQLGKPFLCVEEAHSRKYTTFYLHVVTPERFARSNSPQTYGPYHYFVEVEEVIDHLFPHGGYFWGTYNSFIRFANRYDLVMERH